MVIQQVIQKIGQFQLKYYFFLTLTYTFLYVRIINNGGSAMKKIEKKLSKHIKITIISQGKAINDLQKEYACCNKTQRRSTERL